MNTLVLNSENGEDIKKAGEILRAGGLVAIPTETVYGLAANALDPEAVAKIYKAKGRPGDNPLIVHVCSLEEALPLVSHIPRAAEKLAKAFWPGPLTIIMPKSELVPSCTSGGLNTVAIRIPGDKRARSIISAAAVPLAAPSANRSGRPSPTEFSHVWEDMNGRIAAVVDGGCCSVGLESTVISLVDTKPRLLRPGGITPEQLEAVIGPIEIDASVLKALESGERASSPGMKYKHYAPKAEITLCSYSFWDFKKLMEKEPEYACLCFDGEEELLGARAVSYGPKYNSSKQAKELFSALHRLDSMGYLKVYARPPKKRGVGLAVYNRLIRAAGFRECKPETRIVGLTGPTGAGKSTVAAALRELGAAVIDCDAVSRSPETYTAECIKQLQDAFGSDILNSGVLNRRLLAQRAFTSKEKIKLLNSITLPVISLRILEILREFKSRGEKLIVLDAPTLFEAEADKMCTDILVVDAGEEIRLERILKRDGISLQEAKQRMQAQKPLKYYLDRGDFIIDTSHGLGEQVQLFINNIF